jgi:hypothetical protein
MPRVVVSSAKLRSFVGLKLSFEATGSLIFKSPNKKAASTGRQVGLGGVGMEKPPVL